MKSGYLRSAAQRLDFVWVFCDAFVAMVWVAMDSDVALLWYFSAGEEGLHFEHNFSDCLFWFSLVDQSTHSVWSHCHCLGTRVVCPLRLLLALILVVGPVWVSQTGCPTLSYLARHSTNNLCFLWLRLLPYLCGTSSSKASEVLSSSVHGFQLV